MKRVQAIRLVPRHCLHVRVNTEEGRETGAVMHTCILGVQRLRLLRRVVVLAVQLHSPQAVHEHPEGGPSIAVDVHTAQ